MRFFDEVQEALAVPTSNRFARFLARQSRFVIEDRTDNLVETPRVICLAATEFSTPILFPSKPVSVVSDTLQKVVVEVHEVEKPFPK